MNSCEAFKVRVRFDSKCDVAGRLGGSLALSPAFHFHLFVLGLSLFLTLSFSCPFYGLETLFSFFFFLFALSIIFSNASVLLLPFILISLYSFLLRSIFASFFDPPSPFYPSPLSLSMSIPVPLFIISFPSSIYLSPISLFTLVYYNTINLRIKKRRKKVTEDK